MDVVAYDVPAWGVGELYFRAGKLLYHELPRAGSTSGESGSHSLVDSDARRTSAASESPSGTSSSTRSGATPFQQALADALRDIPWGEVVTYGELAALAGRPRAPRAAGTFCAENNFPLVVPCHRVVSSAGLGSYGPLGRRVQAAVAGAGGCRALSLSDDVRQELAAIEPRKACCRLAELSALVRGAGKRPPARRRSDRAPSRAGQRAGRAAGVLAPPLLRRSLRDQDVQTACVRAGDALPASPRGRRPRPAGAERGRNPRREPRAARAPAKTGRRTRRAAARPTSAAPFSLPGR